MAFAGGHRSRRERALAAIVLALLILFPTTLAAQEPDPSPDADAELEEQAGEGEVADASRKGTETVSMRDFKFAPKKVTIDVGDEIRWRNRGDEPHNATGKGNSFDTPDLDPGDDADERFNDAGTYEYVCTIHRSMKGTVQVQAEGDASAGGGSGDIEDPITAPPTDDSSTSTGLSDDSLGSTGSDEPSGTLPETGNEEIPLFALGAALLAAGLLTGAAAAWAEWAR
jgi:plastocyanin